MFSSVSTAVHTPTEEKVANYFALVKFDEDEDVLIDQPKTFHEILINIQQNKGFTHLVLGENYLTCGQIELLAQNIREHRNLRVLDLTRNGKPVDGTAISSLKKLLRSIQLLKNLFWTTV